MSSKARILVVDDNRSLVRVIERTLEKEGYEVVTAFNLFAEDLGAAGFIVKPVAPSQLLDVIARLLPTSYC